MPLTHPEGAAVRRRLVAAQRSLRLPTVSAAIGHAGEPPLDVAVGDPAPGADVQYRIGSITKTFTAVLVLAERDAGRLDLDDPLGRYLPEVPFGHLRLRDLLAHRSGLRTEPPPPFWEAAPGRDEATLLAGLRADDVVLPPERAWHYSNLGYALLGLVVARSAGAPFREVLAERLLRPLGLEQTTWRPEPPFAPGLRAVPGTDGVVAEPTPDTAAMGPAGQLWSTPGDLFRWGSFLVAPDPAVLAPSTAAEMAAPAVVVDAGTWTGAAGLGLQLVRVGDRVLAGHGGSMPGFTAGLLVDRAAGTVAAVCGNRWRAAGLSSLAAELLDEVRAVPEPPPWTPASGPPAATVAAFADLAGRWWWRWLPFDVAVAGDGLVLREPEEPADRFAPAGGDRFVGVDGGTRGEALVVVRDAAGRPVRLDLGGLRLTRDPDDVEA